MGPIGCPETSVNNYQHTLRNNSEEQKPQTGNYFQFSSTSGPLFRGHYINAVNMRTVVSGFLYIGI
jgi:hypothetical protein